MSRHDLLNAKQEKQNEFYTQLCDIENELKHYKKQFNGKVVFCNCDDPYESNFFKYFANNFNELKLKRLIATCYDGSPFAGTQLSFFDEENSKSTKNAYKIIINEVEDYNKDGATDLSDVEYLIKNKKNVLSNLKGNGDFRSKECIELLKEADIVVTNPPFSLFREYIYTLIKYNKLFVVIGNTNALTYREIFKLFKDNKIRTGFTNFNTGMYFYVPDNTERYHKIDNGRKLVRVSTSCWFSNLQVSKHNESLVDLLYKKYNQNDYPKFENFDAINVNNYKEIPENYYGIMGVPITYLDKHNPSEFKIIGLGISNSGLEVGVKPYKLRHSKYRKEVQHKGAVNGDLYMVDKNDHPIVPYARILIKRIKK